MKNDDQSILTTSQAKRFYDAFGAKQDRQAFYEDAAIHKLIENADLENAASVFEFGVGTGRLAEIILSEHLPDSSNYHGVDLSSTMVSLAQNRLARFSERTSVERTDGGLQFNFPSNSFDRFISTYVLELLSQKNIDNLLLEAHRLLSPNGLVCLSVLSTGCGFVSKTVASAWKQIHRIRPQIVGGCRPIQLASSLNPAHWQILFTACVAPWGIPSEIVVAKKVESKL